MRPPSTRDVGPVRVFDPADEALAFLKVRVVFSMLKKYINIILIQQAIILLAVPINPLLRSWRPDDR